MRDLHRERKIAEQEGYNSRRFDAVINGKRVHCKWVDAYFGLIEVIGKGNVWIDTLDPLCDGVLDPEPRQRA